MNLDAHGLTVALASFREPLGQGSREALGVDTKASFKQAFSGRKGVVEFGRAGEIAHGKAVEPIERAQAALAIDDDLDLEFAGVHSTPKYSTGKVVTWVTREVLLAHRDGCEQLAFAARVS